MNDVQLLAHLLTMSGSELSRAREQAHVLLDAHRDLEHVLSMSREDMLDHSGLAEGEAAFLLLLPALIDRYTAAGSGRPIRPDNEADLNRLLWPHFYGQINERICAFFLDGELRPISAAVVGQGDRTSTPCSTRRVLELTLNHSAKWVLLAHNHPDGILTFSKSDLIATGALARELGTVNVPLLDHYLLAGGRILSLRQYAQEAQLQNIFKYYLPQYWFPPEKGPAQP